MFLLLTLICVVEGIVQDPRNAFYDYAVVQPTIYEDISSRRDVHNSEVVENGKVLKLEFQMFDKNFFVELIENKDMFSPDYKEIHKEDGKEIVYKPSKAERKCYYKGDMPNVEGSWAAISTCNGISGVISDGKETYYIEPSGSSIHNEHLLFKASDYKQKQLRCGVEDSLFSLRGKKLEVVDNDGSYRRDNSPRYIEIIVINGNAMYKKYKGNMTIIKDRTKQAINIANAKLSQLNVFPILLSTYVWTTKDEFEVSKDVTTNLEHFQKFRNDVLLPREPHDNAIFIADEKFEYGAAGASFTSGICSDRSVETVADYIDAIGTVGHTIAHEIGHNLGIPHDHDMTECKCVEKYCIMFPFMLSDILPNHWSSCSMDALEVTKASGLDSCLKNKPSKLVLSACDNKHLEPGEECDM